MTLKRSGGLPDASARSFGWSPGGGSFPRTEAYVSISVKPAAFTCVQAYVVIPSLGIPATQELPSVGMAPPRADRHPSRKTGAFVGGWTLNHPCISSGEWAKVQGQMYHDGAILAREGKTRRYRSHTRRVSA